MPRRHEDRQFALPPADGDHPSAALHALWPVGQETFRILLSTAPLLAGRGPGACRVEVDAPPEAVWPWLTQMMRGGGMYGWPRLETPACCSADLLLDDLSPPEVGDRVGEVLELVTVVPLHRMTWQGCGTVGVLGLGVAGLEIDYRLEPGSGRGSRLSARTRLGERQLTRPLRQHVCGVVEFVLPVHQLPRIARLSESPPGSGNGDRRPGRHQALPLQPASMRPSRRA